MFLYQTQQEKRLALLNGILLSSFDLEEIGKIQCYLGGARKFLEFDLVISLNLTTFKGLLIIQYSGRHAPFLIRFRRFHLRTILK